MISEKGLLMHRCRVARDYVFSARNHTGSQSLFHNCEAEAEIIWRDISHRLQNMIYNQPKDFLHDIQRLKALLIPQCKTSKQEEHMNIVFDRVRELAQVKQPLVASVQNKCCTNSFQLVFDSATADNAMSIMSALRDYGRTYGDLVKNVSVEDAVPPKRKQVSKSKKRPNKVSMPTRESIGLSKANSRSTCKTKSGTCVDEVPAAARDVKVAPEVKRKCASLHRVSQRPPSKDCTPHPVFYGVWEHTVARVFHAQVVIFGETINLGTSFLFAHQAAKAVDRAVLRTFGPELCGTEDLNFNVSVYAQEDLQTLCQYDTQLRVALMWCKQWKGLQKLDFGFLIRRRIGNSSVKSQPCSSESAESLPSSVSTNKTSVPSCRNPTCDNSKSKSGLSSASGSSEVDVGYDDVVTSPKKTVEQNLSVDDNSVAHNSDSLLRSGSDVVSDSILGRSSCGHDGNESSSATVSSELVKASEISTRLNADHSSNCSTSVRKNSSVVISRRSTRLNSCSGSNISDSVSDSSSSVTTSRRSGRRYSGDNGRSSDSVVDSSSPVSTVASRRSNRLNSCDDNSHGGSASEASVVMSKSSYHVQPDDDSSCGFVSDNSTSVVTYELNSGDGGNSPRLVSGSSISATTLKKSKRLNPSDGNGSHSGSVSDSSSSAVSRRSRRLKSDDGGGGVNSHDSLSMNSAFISRRSRRLRFGNDGGSTKCSDSDVEGTTPSQDRSLKYTKRNVSTADSSVARLSLRSRKNSNENVTIASSGSQSKVESRANSRKRSSTRLSQSRFDGVSDNSCTEESKEQENKLDPNGDHNTLESDEITKSDEVILPSKRQSTDTLSTSDSKSKRRKRNERFSSLASGVSTKRSPRLHPGMDPSIRVMRNGKYSRRDAGVLTDTTGRQSRTIARTKRHRDSSQEISASVKKETTEVAEPVTSPCTTHSTVAQGRHQKQTCKSSSIAVGSDKSFVEHTSDSPNHTGVNERRLRGGRKHTSTSDKKTSNDTHLSTEKKTRSRSAVRTNTNDSTTATNRSKTAPRIGSTTRLSVLVSNERPQRNRHPVVNRENGNVTHAKKSGPSANKSTRAQSLDLKTCRRAVGSKPRGVFEYVSADVSNGVKSSSGRLLSRFIGCEFTDLEVPKSDPFRHGYVTDIVQINGRGAYLFKFYNPKIYTTEPSNRRQSAWAYQGCDEIISKPSIYAWSKK